MRLLIWRKGLTQTDLIIEDVERILLYGDDDSITYKLWSKQEKTIDGVQRIMVID